MSNAGKTIGEVLGELRRSGGYTQTEQARGMHITQSEVSRIENQGDLLLSTLVQYATVALPPGWQLELVSGAERIRLPLRSTSKLVDPAHAAPDTPPAQPVFIGPMTVPPRGGRPGPAQRYYVEVWELASGERVAIVTQSSGSMSVLNNSENIFAAIVDQYATNEVLQHWPGGWNQGGSRTEGEGLTGGYGWSEGDGGWRSANLNDLAERGLYIR